MADAILVTGASSGIGAASARLLAQRGFSVFGTSRRARGSDGAIRWIQLDVCDEGSVRAGVEQALREAGRLDGVVCNAGDGIFGSVEEVDLERARRQLETNFFGVLRTLRAVLPGMREAGTGRLVLIGSLAARAPIPFQAHYSASKAALAALALALANEVEPCGIRVSLIEPGDIRTEFNRRMDWGDLRSSAYAERLGRCARVVEDSLRAAPEPEVVARVVARALTARRPRLRYAVGPDSLLAPLAHRLLPDRWWLRVIRSRFRV